MSTEAAILALIEAIAASIVLNARTDPEVRALANRVWWDCQFTARQRQPRGSA